MEIEREGKAKVQLERDEVVEPSWDKGSGEVDQSFHRVEVEYVRRVQHSDCVDISEDTL